MIVSKPLLVISNIAEFHMNLNLSIIVLCLVLSSTLIIADPDSSSINGASTFINLFSFGFNTMHSFGKMTLPNSNIFLIPKTKSMFSCISDT